MSMARFIVGDALEELRKLPDVSVDLVLSSPPFLALRSYLPPDDPRKAQEMGSEATPGEFIDRLLEVVEECRRVLAPHGTLVLELGDTYAGSGGAGGDYSSAGLRAEQPEFRGSAYAKRYESTNGRTGPGRGVHEGWPLEKSLTLIPESVRWALAYGRNPFTGRETPRWRIRNVVRWIRPNPPVGALADKFRPATSEFLVACMSKTRWFDMEAVRTLPSPDTHARLARAVDSVPNRGKASDDKRRGGNFSTLAIQRESGGAPPLDWFEQDEDFPEALKITAGGYRGAHYAVFPEKVVGPFIEAMCPRQVCLECGEPSRRIVKPRAGYAELLGKSWADRDTGRPKSITGARTNHGAQPAGVPHLQGAEYETTGWSDCGHDQWRRGLVLDPFCGSGTTLAVAVGRGRDALGIDLDERNLDLARERVGMFLEASK